MRTLTQQQLWRRLSRLEKAQGIAGGLAIAFGIIATACLALLYGISAHASLQGDASVLDAHSREALNAIGLTLLCSAAGFLLAYWTEKRAIRRLIKRTVKRMDNPPYRYYGLAHT